MKEAMEHLVPQVYNMEKDKFYMEIAKLAASKSKDPKTKVGSCIVNNDRLLSIGYNGAPRGFPDEDIPKDSDEFLPANKNSYMIHSEVNAVLNYGGPLKDLQNATLYVTISPCHECAKVIIQTGIKRVVYLEEYHKSEVWHMAKVLFQLGKVKYEKYSD